VFIILFYTNEVVELTTYSAIKSLPSIVKSVFQAIMQLTGWVFFVSAGGPNPSDDGHIYMEK